MMEQRMLRALLGVKKEVAGPLAISREEMIAYVLKTTNIIPVAARVDLLKLFKDRCPTMGFSECHEGVVLNLDKLPTEAILAAYKFITHTREKRL